MTVGGQLHRYVITPGKAAAGPTGGSDVVLVDLGGPGRSLFADRGVNEIVAAWPGDQRLMVLEEPWVSRPLSEGCGAALTSFYRWLRLAPPVGPAPASQAADGGPPERLVRACGLAEDGSWGWSSSRYRQVVDAALRAEHGRLVGTVGASFGAARASDLWAAAFDLRWVVLNSPAPVGISAQEYLDGRRHGAMLAFKDGCVHCDAGAVDAAVARFASAPIVLDDRTPEVTGVDVAAAVVGLPYRAGAERREMVGTLLRDPRAAAPWIGQLSDSVLLRFGEYDMSPAALAYFSEICAQYAGWRALRAPSGPVEALLTRLHAPCRYVPGRVAPPPSRSGVPACLATADDDYVTPPALTDPWLKRFPGAVRVREASEGHAKAARAVRCYERLTGTGASGRTWTGPARDG